MVTEVRRGNLDVRGKVPGSIEFGALVKGFSEMAGELREMRDSLEQKVRERTAELENTQHELVQTAKLSSLGQLVSGVAHEINNPLTSILGFSELALTRTQLDPGLRVQLQTIRDEAVRLKNLVVSLSTFARRGTQRTARLDLRQALDRLVNLRRYQLGANNIELHFDRPPGSVWVEGDLDLLVQVLFNLVLNSEQAIQSCRTRGDIWLGCGVEAGRAWATVRDNGAGMSPAVRERIFDPFFTTKPIGQGTGLGLSISHGIIQQHRGSISAESVEGQGTNMRIVLPVADPPKSAGGEPAHSEAAAMENRDAWSGPLALVVDDEPAISQLVGQFLESRGWRAVILNDSTAVEASLAEQPFALVICDLKMPGMNGLDVLRLLRHKQPKLAQRFLLMTGNLADAEQMQNVELAGIPILRKPFALSRLAESLDALLKNEG
jgi:two-component system NtrC family sensor kinase